MLHLRRALAGGRTCDADAPHRRIDLRELATREEPGQELRSYEHEYANRRREDHPQARREFERPEGREACELKAGESRRHA